MVASWLAPGEYGSVWPTPEFAEDMTVVSPTRRELLAGAAHLAGVAALGSIARAEEASMPSFNADDLAKAFVARHEAEVRPLEKASNLAWWVANVSGKDSDFAAKEQAQNRLDAVLADRDRFDQLKKIKEGSVSDPLLARQVDVLYLLYQEKQVDPGL